MFLLAVLLGIYGEGIFILGVFGLLYGWIIGLWTIVICCICAWYYICHCEHSEVEDARRVTIFSLVMRLPPFKVAQGKLARNDKGVLITLVLLILLAIVNLIGVLGPETSFDALWYHLTLPKIYLSTHSINFIPGGLLYYSVMPKLGEMLFIPVLLFGDEIWAKGIQFVFGILTTIAVYKISRRYFSVSLSMVASLVFYSNIVVSWESTTAYIDLIRAFYEVMGLWGFLLWFDTKKRGWLYMSALMVGFAISTKLLAVGSLIVFSILLFSISLFVKRQDIKTSLGSSVIFASISIGIVMPWLIFAYAYTGNPVYPFFTSLYPVMTSSNIYSIQTYIAGITKLFLFSDDPISPVYLIVLPSVCLYFSKLKPALKIIGYYSIFALMLWYITPRTGGGRFILTYLPAFSILAIAVLEKTQKQKIIYGTILFCILFLAIATIEYRGTANSRYIPVILGKESKDEFLAKRLNFTFGDFYDTDGYFKAYIKPTDTVLLYGFHNLYYVNFPFIDSSWVKKGDKFTYIATQNTILPKRFKNWTLVYENNTTLVRLYKNGEKTWEY